MKYCIYCGKAAGDEAKFCPKCGKKIDYVITDAAEENGKETSYRAFKHPSAGAPGGRDRQERRTTAGFIILILVLAAFFIVYRNKIRLPAINLGGTGNETEKAVIIEETKTGESESVRSKIRIPAE